MIVSGPPRARHWPNRNVCIIHIFSFTAVRGLAEEHWRSRVVCRINVGSVR